MIAADKPNVDTNKVPLAGLIFSGLILFSLVLPGEFLAKLVWLNSGICPQRPAHSYIFNNQQMPLEARMIGIFGAFFLTLVALWFVGRGRAVQWPRKELSIALVGLIAIMAFDGLNATAYDLGWFRFYPPQNWLRAITGALSGVGMAGLLLPVYSLTLWRRAYLVPTFKHLWEIGLALIQALLLAFGMISGWEWLFWPISLLAVAGVVGMLTMFNFVIFLTIVRRENQFVWLKEMALPAVLVLLFSLAQMGLFALLRLATLSV